MDVLLEGGFADPVQDSQKAFRSILDALANPGQVQDLPVPAANNADLPPELVSIVLTLTDHDTPLWFAEGYPSSSLAGYVGFHTGAPILADPSRARFAFGDASSLPPLDRFNLGTQDYPDRSTTLVIPLPALTGGRDLLLRGPGIRSSITISPKGLPESFVAQWAANRELFPRGIDLLLVSGGKVLGLPRSTRIEEV